MKKYHLFLEVSRTSYNTRSETYSFDELKDLKSFVEEIRKIEKYDFREELIQAVINKELELSKLNSYLNEIEKLENSTITDVKELKDIFTEAFWNSYGVMEMMDDSLINSIDSIKVIYGEEIKI